jgi:hypothetical protein
MEHTFSRLLAAKALKKTAAAASITTTIFVIQMMLNALKLTINKTNEVNHNNSWTSVDGKSSAEKL